MKLGFDIPESKILQVRFTLTKYQRECRTELAAMLQYNLLKELKMDVRLRGRFLTLNIIGSDQGVSLLTHASLINNNWVRKGAV